MKKANSEQLPAEQVKKRRAMAKVLSPKRLGENEADNPFNFTNKKKKELDNAVNCLPVTRASINSELDKTADFGQYYASNPLPEKPKLSQQEII
jgi:hypothetical protein